MANREATVVIMAVWTFRLRYSYRWIERYPAFLPPDWNLSPSETSKSFDSAPRTGRADEDRIGGRAGHLLWGYTSILATINGSQAMASQINVTVNAVEADCIVCLLHRH